MSPHPDPARRRRRGAAAFGLVALPLVGSAFVLPAVASAAQGPAPAPAAFARPSTTDPATDPDQAAVEAYLAAGYSFDDALALAAIWGLEPDPFQVKVKAGAILADGQPLDGSVLSDPTAADGVADAQLVDLFFALGYTGEDAQVLADEWGLDLGEAKVAAGRELKVVGVLPFVDPAVVESAPGDDDAVAAFFDTGYDYDDAVLLAEHWRVGEPYEAKLKAGRLLQSGEALPPVPGVGD